MMLDTALQRSIAVHADGRDLPIQLVTAIIRVESGADTFAWNPEPPYRYLVNAQTRKPFRKLTRAEIKSETPPDDFPSCPGLADDRDAEWWGQQASWGLMQVMGAVARERGFKQHFPALCNPEVGLLYGCRHIEKLRDKFLSRYGWDGVTAAYNAGSPRRRKGKWVNQPYVDKVRLAGGFGFEEVQHTSLLEARTEGYERDPT